MITNLQNRIQTNVVSNAAINIYNPHGVDLGMVPVPTSEFDNYNRKIGTTQLQNVLYNFDYSIFASCSEHDNLYLQGNQKNNI